MQRRLLLPFLLLTAASARSQPATQPVYPAWAMKCYPNPITRMVFFDHVDEAIALGESTLKTQEHDKAPVLERVGSMSGLFSAYLVDLRLKSAAEMLARADALLKDLPHDRDSDLARADILSHHAKLETDSNEVTYSEKHLAEALALHKQYQDDDILSLRRSAIINKIIAHSATADKVLPEIDQLIADASTAFGPDSGPVVEDLYLKAGCEIYLAADFDAAAAAARACQVTAGKAYGGESSFSADAVFIEGLALEMQRQFNEAIAKFESARILTAKARGKNCQSLATIEKALGFAYMQIGDTEAAEASFKNAVRVTGHITEENPQRAASALDDLAKYYRSGNQDDLAAAAENNAADVRKKYKLPVPKN
jgi:tetratricopeptide (TPR) repeat protein